MKETNRRTLLRACAGGIATATLALAMRRARAADEAPMVRIDNFTFSPTPVTVPAGATIVWVNEDDIPHSIYCEALNLRSHPLDTNDRFAHQFDQPGSFDYVCGIHPHMRGRIVVG